MNEACKTVLIMDSNESLVSAAKLAAEGLHGRLANGLDYVVLRDADGANVVIEASAIS